jgi:glutamine amidotransferase
MGWNALQVVDGGGIVGSLDGADVYFAHSYACEPSDLRLVAAETEHETRVVAVVERGAIAGVQFHPERSGAAGARLLRNVLAWSRSA